MINFKFMRICNVMHIPRECNFVGFKSNTQTLSHTHEKSCQVCRHNVACSVNVEHAVCIDSNIIFAAGPVQDIPDRLHTAPIYQVV